MKRGETNQRRRRLLQGAGAVTAGTLGVMYVQPDLRSFGVPAALALSNGNNNGNNQGGNNQGGNNQGGNNQGGNNHNQGQGNG